MEIYKIYAKCCTSSKPIKKIDMKEAEELIQEAIYDMVNNGGIEIKDGSDEEIDEKYCELFDKATRFFKENKYFNCGDFSVEITDKPVRSNIYGYMGWLFE